MRFWGITAVLALAVGVLSGTAAYYWSREPVAEPRREAIEWVKQEFRLSPTQAARIAELHALHGERCAEHCLAIQRARRQLRQAREQARGADEIHAAEEHLAQVDQACRDSLSRHVHEIASVMADEEGRRYLSIVLPRIATFDHHASPDLRLSPGESHHAHGH